MTILGSPAGLTRDALRGSPGSCLICRPGVETVTSRCGRETSLLNCSAFSGTASGAVGVATEGASVGVEAGAESGSAEDGSANGTVESGGSGSSGANTPFVAGSEAVATGRPSTSNLPV